MKFRKFFSHRTDSPMGALNDLSFLLIIYFLVIAGFNVNQGFLLDLPSQDKPRVVHKEDLLRLGVTESGDLTAHGKVLDREALTEIIIQSLTDHPNITVVLSIDPKAPYQKVVDVIHVVRTYQVQNFSFFMAEKKDGHG